jgi:hypothetical protein
MLGRRPASARPLVDRRKPHQLHQPFDTLAINRVTLNPKPRRRHMARAV